MPKSPRRRNPLEEYDRFMIAGKNPASRRALFALGAWVGNSALWLLSLINVARISAVFAFVLVAAVTWGIVQRISPTLELTTVILISAIIALIIVAIGVVLLKLILRRDARRLGQNPTFGVFDEDARSRDKQNYRRKSGR